MSLRGAIRQFGVSVRKTQCKFVCWTMKMHRMNPRVKNSDSNEAERLAKRSSVREISDRSLSSGRCRLERPLVESMKRKEGSLFLYFPRLQFSMFSLRLTIRMC